MKLPSFNNLWSRFRNVLFRFPLQSLIAVLAMALWLWASSYPEETNLELIYKVIILCNLGFTCSLSANLFSETREWTAARSFILQLMALVPAIILYAILNPSKLESDAIQLTLILLSGHLLVSFSFWSFRLSEIHFWHFNKVFFLRFVTGVLFSIVLFAGLSLAVLSIQILFDFRFASETFLRLFIIVAVGFNSIFFLSGIPESPSNESADLSLDTSYPKILMVFTQYVLIPLLSVYFGILIVYELKIAFSSQLPDGMVSYLILGYAVFGILSYLLVYPLRNDQGSEWIRQFSRLFFWLIIPLLVLLYIAIWVRVADYGLTEKRYFIIALAVWLSAITLYFNLSRNPGLQLIPISLFIVVLLSTFGPQSASTLSRYSQQNRLKKIMDSKDTESNEEKRSIVTYLVDFHGLPSLQRFSDQDMEQIEQGIYMNQDSLTASYQKKSRLRDTAFQLLQIDPLQHNLHMIYLTSANKLIQNDGYTYSYWLGYPSPEKIEAPWGNLIISSEAEQLKIKLGDRDSITFNISLLESTLRDRFNDLELKKEFIRQGPDNVYTIPQKWLSLKDSSSNFNVELRLQTLSLYLRKKKEDRILPSISGYLLIDKE